MLNFKKDGIQKDFVLVICQNSCKIVTFNKKSNSLQIKSTLNPEYWLGELNT